MHKFDHFDFIAPFYDHFIKLNDPSLISQASALPVSGILLDVGGGTGRVGKAVRDLVDSVVIADISFPMLKQITDRSKIYPACTLSEQLAFPTNLFDRVIIVDALHHVYNAQKTCLEIWRVTKPGGRIVIQEPDIRTTSVKILSIVEKLLLMRSKFHTPLEIAGFFNNPNADIQIKRDRFNTWIIVDKPPL